MSFCLTWELILLIVLSLTGYGFDKENVHCLRELLPGEKEGLIQLPSDKAFVGQH
jgi:hypothetical protein